jgi:hypothetical protein
MKVLIIVAALFLAKAYCGPINAQCENQRFDKCTDTFAKALGLPAMPTDASVLDAQIKKLIGQGQQGKKQVCNAADGLEQCLGDEYHSCISVDYLKSIGESQKDAQQFVAESKQLEQMCASTSFNAPAKCESDKLVRCATTFSKAIGLSSIPTDPSQLDAQIKKLIKEGQQGKTQLCNADNNLKKCLGDEYNSCISVDYLESLGESEKDAKAYNTEAKQIEKTCASTAFNAPAKCEDQRFDKCTDTFAKALGLPSMPTDASVLDAQIKKLIGQGQQGKKQVCHAVDGLQQCLGDEYHSCISVDYLKSIGESQKDAQQFVAESKQLEQMCASTAFFADAKCDADKLNQCGTTFSKAIGLPSLPDYPSQLDAQVQKLIKEGQQGKTQLCNADHNLEKCLGDEYKSCVSVDYLKSLGISQQDAEAYNAEMKQIEKTCA